MTDTLSILPSEFNARRTADLVGKIEAINNGSKEPLTRSEIAVLAKMNAEMVAAMKKRLTDEANTVWDKSTDAATNKAHKDYWDGYATRLQAAIDRYDGKLAQITIGATDDLAKLKETTKPGNVLGDAAIKNTSAAATPSAPVLATASAAPTAAVAAAPATVEKKETAPAITAFMGRITDGTLNPQNRVKTDIIAIGALLAKWDVSKLPKGVELATITTKDLQKVLKVGADGKLGPDTINALLSQMGVSEKYVPKVSKPKKGEVEKTKAVGWAAVKAEKAVGWAAVKAEKSVGWDADKAEDKEIVDYTFV